MFKHTPGVGVYEKIIKASQGVENVNQDTDWATVESNIGFGLPVSYTLYVEQVPLGQIYNYLYIFTPIAGHEFYGLEEAVKRDRADVMSRPADFDLDTIPGLKDSMENVLPIGLTESGDGILLLMEGHKDDWEVIVINYRDCEGYATGLNFGNFITALEDEVPMGEAFPKYLYDENRNEIYSEW